MGDILIKSLYINTFLFDQVCCAGFELSKLDSFLRQ